MDFVVPTVSLSESRATYTSTESLLPMVEIRRWSTWPSTTRATSPTCASAIVTPGDVRVRFASCEALVMSARTPIVDSLGAAAELMRAG